MAVKEKRVFTLTRHARRRLVQRGITLADIEFAIEHGERVYRQGLIFCVMLDKKARRRGESVRNLVVLLSHDHNVITAYKERHAFKKIRKAVKYDLKHAEAHLSS